LEVLLDDIDITSYCTKWKHFYLPKLIC